MCALNLTLITLYHSEHLALLLVFYMFLTSYFRAGPPQALSRDPPVLLSPTTSFQSSPIQAFLVPTPDSGTPSQNRAASLSRNIQQTRGTRPSTTSLGGHRRTPLPNVFGPPSQLPLAAVPSIGTPPVAGPSGTSDSATVWLALLPFTVSPSTSEHASDLLNSC